jgi:hypothetical protein
MTNIASYFAHCGFTMTSELPVDRYLPEVGSPRMAYIGSHKTTLLRKRLFSEGLRRQHAASR